MKLNFKPGSKKEFNRVVTEDDQAAFFGQVLHPVCSTFSLARDFEWASRLFFLEMKDEDEEGVGTFVSIEHKSPAFVGEHIKYIATVVKIHGNELTCSIEAKVGDRLIATGTTGQKMLAKDRIDELFRKKE